jgi:putative FmdB family regulatory protein
MPTYDYLCPNGHRFEVIHSVTADGPTVCPICGASPVRKAFSAPTIHFRGSGWAKKDRSTAARSASRAASAAADGGSGSGSDAAGSGSDGGADAGSGTDKGSGSTSDSSKGADAKPAPSKTSASDSAKGIGPSKPAGPAAAD